jgi:ATP-binding cassette subfamily B protein
LKADEILVIKDNTLAERGTHKELIAAGGFYAELYNIQTPALEHR